MKINIKRINPKAIIPTSGSEYSAGYDLYACIGEGDGEYGEIFQPHETIMIGTGITMEIPNGYFGAIYARSGIANKRGLRPSCCVGVVDCDFRGEIKVSLHNDTNEVQYIEDGERIAQIVIQPYLGVEFNEVDELSDTKRGDGGFGSSGVK